jgi:hypothetical protein
VHGIQVRACRVNGIKVSAINVHGIKARACSVRDGINLLKTKRVLLYIRDQSVPRCKHFPPRL